MVTTYDKGQKFKLKHDFKVGITNANGNLNNIYDMDNAVVFCTLLDNRRTFRSKNTTAVKVESPNTFLLPIHFPEFGIHYYKGLDKIFRDPIHGNNPDYIVADKELRIVQDVKTNAMYRAIIPDTFYMDGIYLLMPLEPGMIVKKQAMLLDEPQVGRCLSELAGKVFSKDTIKGEALYYIFRGSSVTKIFERMPVAFFDRRSDSGEVMLRLNSGVELGIKTKYLEIC